MGKIHKENSSQLKGNKDHVNSFNHSQVSFNMHNRSNAHARPLHKLDSINCIYTNADCLTNKMSELRLHAKNSSPKIIGITEVKPKKLKVCYTELRDSH